MRGDTKKVKDLSKKYPAESAENDTDYIQGPSSVDPDGRNRRTTIIVPARPASPKKDPHVEPEDVQEPVASVPLSPREQQFVDEIIRLLRDKPHSSEPTKENKVIFRGNVQRADGSYIVYQGVLTNSAKAKLGGGDYPSTADVLDLEQTPEGVWVKDPEKFAKKAQENRYTVSDQYNQNLSYGKLKSLPTEAVESNSDIPPPLGTPASSHSSPGNRKSSGNTKSGF